jgi:hypothetical protein
MKRMFLVVLLAITLTVTACSSIPEQKNTSPTINTKITKHPSPTNFNRGSLKVLPQYDSNLASGKAIDLRGYDLSSIDLKDKLNDLMYTDFDSSTIWPKNLPDKFNPEEIMKLGKTPGLGIDRLHEKGITGKSVGIAIIDQALLVDHIEYKDNLKMYEEIHCSDTQAQMHGPAVASIAAGKTVGVAPDADLYYIAETHGDFINSEFIYDFTWTAKSIDRILEVNKTLPNDKKIRVISISVGWKKDKKGYDEVTAAVNRAKDQGIFVVSSSLVNTYGYMFNSLGRNPLNDPKLPSSYEPGLFWADQYYENDKNFYSDWEKLFGANIDQVLLVPMDSRTTASPTGINDYVFYREGGWSWSIPYIAGLYALACQVKPDINPDVFWSAALNTGDTIKVQNNGKEYELKKIVNPVKLMEAIK